MGRLTLRAILRHVSRVGGRCKIRLHRAVRPAVTCSPFDESAPLAGLQSSSTSFSVVIGTTGTSPKSRLRDLSPAEILSRKPCAYLYAEAATATSQSQSIQVCLSAKRILATPKATYK